MAGLPKRWDARIAFAGLLLVSVNALFAQENEAPGPFGSTMIGPVVAAILLALLVAISLYWYRRVGRSDDSKEARGSRLNNTLSVAPQMTGRAPERNVQLPAAVSSAHAEPLASADRVAAIASRESDLPQSPQATCPSPLPTVDERSKVDSVFISYRRHDSQHITGRIYDRLAARFGKELVFKDVDSIPLGLDFREHIREQVGRCAVLLAVIGRNWNPLAASGQPRLSDLRDHLRIEIESALERNIPVIPVLVDGVESPNEDDLPKSLASLAYRNGMPVRPDPDFHHDMDRLVRGIEQLLK